MPDTRTALTRDLEDAARTERNTFEAAWAQPWGYDPDSVLAHQHQQALRERNNAIQRLLADGASYEDAARAARLTPEGIRRLSERYAEPSDRPLNPPED
ncbi:MAG: hypothetical protein OXI76_00865 [Gemmatimonadota bacterium]|nr:hypothetical protein [Gemmatimonadota bacterium]